MLRFFLFLALSAIIFCTKFALGEDQKNYALLAQNQSEQIAELKKRIETLEKTVEFLNSKANSSAQSSETNQTGPNLQNGETALETNKVETEKDQYDTALALLKNDKFAEAEEKFAKFIEQHPKSTLKENAVFWHAETFYRREDFSQAAIFYLKSYKEYPKGPKAADSLFKLSLSLGSINKLKEACSIIDKLEAEFPNRPDNSVKRTNEAKLKFLCKKPKAK